jgi:hypothetical protein
MKSFGVNDWIQYGWGTELNDEWKVNDALCFKLTSPIHSSLSLDAAILAVRQISISYPGPYTLFCSGGVDSQAMIWAWHLSGVPFTIVSVKYVSNNIWFNEHDLVTLVEFCKLHSLSIVFKNFDIISFLENDLSKVALANDCDSPQINTHIKMTDLVDRGTILFSGNVMLTSELPLSYTLLGTHRYSLTLSDDKQIIPFFFLHDPTLATSIATLKHVNMPTMYCNAGYPVIPQSSHFTGFEQIKIYYDKYIDRITPMIKLKFSSKPSKRVFDLLFRYPYEGTGKCKANCHIHILSKEHT